MIKFDDFIRDAREVLPSTYVDDAIDKMELETHVHKKHLGLFIDRFEYAEEYLRALSFCAAYIALPAEDLLKLVSNIDRSSPPEFIFALTFIVYSYESFGKVTFDGLRIPKNKRNKTNGDYGPVEIYSQFPLRFSDFQRDIDFVIRLGRAEFGVEIDGMMYHIDEKANVRDLSTEVLMQTIGTPLDRVRASILRDQPFTYMHGLCASHLPHDFYSYNKGGIKKAPSLFVIKLEHKPCSAHEFVAGALDYYYRARVVFSMNESITSNEKSIKSFVLKYQSLRVNFVTTDECITCTASLELSLKVTVHALLTQLFQLDTDFEGGYTYSLYEEGNIKSIEELLISERNSLIRRRLQFIRNKSFLIDDELKSALNDMEPYNYNALKCNQLAPEV